MTVTIDLFEQYENVMIFRAIFPWTVIEWTSALRKSTEISQQNAIDYVIFDVTEGGTIPRNFLSSLQAIQNNYKGNVKRRILVGNNLFIKTMFRIVDAVNPRFTHEFYMVATLTDARTLIEKWCTEKRCTDKAF